MIIAVCAALNAAAVPLLQAPSPATGVLQSWLVKAQAQVSVCQNDVRFLVSLGRLHSRLGQHEAASEHLERALLLAPEDPQALRAFSAVLQDLGDPSAAAQVLAMLPPGSQPDPWGPNDLSANKANPRMASQALPAVHSGVSAKHETESGRWKTLLSLTAGRERNPLGVSSQSNITLTLPGLDPSQPVIITLPIDEASRPRPAAYTQFSAAAQYNAGSGTATANPSEWSLQLGSRVRQVPTQAQAGFAVLEAAIDHQRRYAASPWGHYTNASGAYLDSRTGIRFGQAALGAGLVGGIGACQGRVGAEWLDRRYLSNKVLDGRQRVGVAQLACTPALSFTVKKGMESPRDPGRPGGAQELLEMRVRGAWGRWAWEFDRGHLSDERGYSALIESGAVRDQRRWGARLERVLLSFGGQAADACQACPAVQLVAGAELQRRQSNINLFESNNLGAYMALQFTN